MNTNGYKSSINTNCSASLASRDNKFLTQCQSETALMSQINTLCGGFSPHIHDNNQYTKLVY